MKHFAKLKIYITQKCVKFRIWSGAKEYKSRRSRKMLKNALTLAIRGVDTEENEPPKVEISSIVYTSYFQFTTQ